jgi:DNA polymerase
VLGGPAQGLGELQGRVIEHNGRRIVPAWHPSYVLRLQDDAAREEARAALVQALRVAQTLIGDRKIDAIS